MIPEAELARMKARAEKAVMFSSYTGATERLRLIAEVEELQAALREIVRSSENLTAPIKFELFAAIGKARTTLGET